MRGAEQRFVYILRSSADPLRHYVGISSNPDDRLDWHNNGPGGYTRAYRPWALVVAIAFQTEREAARFERYLKTGSGRAFTKRHFGPRQT
jgi:predicted GIY-YIG superfamily endonuclease